MILQVKLENKGHLVGTSGWLKNEVFEGSYLSIRKLRDGHPGLFLIGKNKEGEETKDLICFIDTESNDNYQYWGDSVWSIYPIATGDLKGFSGVFTPAALSIFERFIEVCVELLKELWGSDKEGFEISIK